MGMTSLNFADLLDHLAGREDPAVAGTLADDAQAADLAARAGRLLLAGRRAAAAPAPSRKLLARARRIFVQERREALPRRGKQLLELLLDTLRTPRPALALRRGRATPVQPRFLKFGGACTVELQVTPMARGLELRGQVTPAATAREAVLTVGARTRRAAVAAEGTFLFTGLPRGRIELTLGSVVIRDVDI